MEEHLLNMKNNTSIPQDHIDYLYKLKSNGFEPNVIYDIGCCVLQWTSVAQTLWPNAKIILFDAFTKAEFLYKDYDYFLGVLSNNDNNIVNFYQNDYYPTGNSYYKEIGHSCSSKLFNENNISARTTYKLDTIVDIYNFPYPDLVKIDVQGCEKDVIQGGTNTLKDTTHLIVELQSVQYNLNAPLVNETLPFIENIGFKCISPLFCNNGPDGDYDFINVKYLK
jgi:FkbM family methyltransferase